MVAQSLEISQQGGKSMEVKDEAYCLRSLKNRFPISMQFFMKKGHLVLSTEL